MAVPLALIFPIMPLVLSRLLAPRKPSEGKQDPYECGAETIGDAWIRFGVQYYTYALLFVVFEVEIVLLFPSAMVLKQFGVVGIVEVGVFLGILVMGLVYAWGRGVLEWE